MGHTKPHLSLPRILQMNLGFLGLQFSFGLQQANPIFAYLGADESAWAAYDATLLMRKRGFDGPMLIDQGTQDANLDLLKPEALAEAMVARRQNGAMRMQKGYDHSYFFISTFMDDHLRWHAARL